MFASPALAFFCANSPVRRGIQRHLALLLCAGVLLLAGESVAPSPAYAGLNGSETDLDKRVKAYLQDADKRWPLLPENPAYPKPNNELKYGFGEAEYYQKALSVFGLIDMGAAPKTRIPEVNRLLRYAVLGAWPATTPASVIGQYATAWPHRDRTIAMRLFMLYADWLEPDVKAEWNKRINWLATTPYTSSSENIRWANNSAYFLAYEILGRTSTQGFKDIKTWVVDQLKRQGNEGPSEWGSFYNAWTYSAILNLADFAKDTQVQKLAQMAFDMWLARHSGGSYHGRLGTGGLRCYPWWIHGVLRAQTTCSQLMMVGSPEAKGGDWLEFAITNYRAPSVIRAMHERRGIWEAWVQSNTQPDMRYYHYHADKFVIGVTMSPEAPDIFRSFGGGTHDIAGIYIQSGTNKPGTNPGQSSVMPLGYQPEKPPAKRINLVERYFGYKHVAFAQHGGTTKAVYAGGSFPGISIRLFATHDFSHEFDSGWAFLTNGTVYVAWAPTLGDPQSDPKSSSWYDPNKQGYVLQSSYVGDDKGEACVIDVGDAASYGSYANFKAQVKARNPRPRWVGDKVTYKALDGTVLEWSATGVTINGVAWSRSQAPKTSMPGLQGLQITEGGSPLTYNFDTATTTGTIVRIPSNMTFGVSGTKPTPDPLSIQTPAALPAGVIGTAYGPVALIAAGGIPPYVSWKVAGTPPLPDGITLAESTGVLAGNPQKVGTFQTTLRVTDSAGATHSRTFTFSFSAQSQNGQPLPADKMFVHSNNAQIGSGGNPVPDIDSSPVFSAVYTDPDPGDKADRVYIQVSTDETFEAVDAWNSGVIPLAAPVANGARCADIPYGGQPLQPGTTYYWRMIFVDVAGHWGELHTEQFSFQTSASKNNAPLAPSGMFVGSTSAQTGAAGSISKPVPEIDLDPVFSAVFEDPDTGDTTAKVWIQVATDPSFQESSLVWNVVPFGTGTGELSIAPCTAKARCADFAYGGKPLNPNTQYYWRMLFVDVAGQAGLPSATSSFFTASPNPDPLSITTTSLADATEAQGYNQPLAAMGGRAPYTWTTANPLPTGLALDSIGSLFGTPAVGTANTYTIALTATDAKGATADATFPLKIVPEPHPPLQDSGPPEGPLPQDPSPPFEIPPHPDTPTPDEGTTLDNDHSGSEQRRPKGCACATADRSSFPAALLALLCLLCILGSTRPTPQTQRNNPRRPL